MSIIPFFKSPFPAFSPVKFAHVTSCLIGASAIIGALSAQAATLAPAPVLDIGLSITLTATGSVYPANRTNNIASPVAVGSHLYVVNQRAGTISIRYDNGTLATVLNGARVPAGVTMTGSNQILNMAGADGRVYVTYTSSTLPPDFAQIQALPDDPAYGTAKVYQLVYTYDQAENGLLSAPRALTAFETSTVAGVHQGGGMLVLPDGNLLIARGDNLGGDHFGGTGAQALDNSVAKLLIINKDSGDVSVAATGLRNVQQIVYTDDSHTRIAFSDIGWRAAEEINVLDLADLTNAAAMENFGWGIAADGMAREGIYYIGYDGNGTTEKNATILGQAPADETGFIQPYAQFGRDGAPQASLFAATGPITSSASFSSIGMLFGDLVSGDLYATLAGATEQSLNDVYKVWVLDENGDQLSLKNFLFENPSASQRVELRLFTFADGTAGLMSEQLGTIYRIAEVPLPAVPLPAAGFMLLSALGLCLVTGQRGTPRS